MEIAAAKQVQMKMKDGLAGACAVVEDRAIAREKIAFAGELRGDQMQLADHGLVFGLRVVQRNEMFSRAEQDVRGRLRADVLESENFGIFVDDF